MECSICITKFNGSYRKEVECLYCGHSACQKCVERYLIENTIIPRCMSCKTEWNMEFLRSKLSRSFMDKDFKEHQAEALLIQAEAEIGQYQERAAFEIRAEEALKEYQEARRIYKEARLEMIRQQNRYYRVLRGENKIEAVARADFFLACPRTDCRGRVSTGYKCGLCEHFFCPQCHGDKGFQRDAPHECAQDDIDTVRLLRENTRNCPKCKMGIFKTQGCDQMWCVACQTAFSWNTGNILNGPIHNPEFYDFQRRQRANGIIPRQPGDVVCGGMPTYHQIRQRIQANRESAEIEKKLSDTHRLINHIEHVTMPAVHRKYNQRQELFQTHGVAYLRGLIDRIMLRTRLYKATRQEEKFRRYYQILETMMTNIQEVMRQYLAGEIDGPTADKGCDELFSYANSACEKMRKQFKMSIPVFASDMQTHRMI